MGWLARVGGPADLVRGGGFCPAGGAFSWLPVAALALGVWGRAFLVRGGGFCPGGASSWLPVAVSAGEAWGVVFLVRDGGFWPAAGVSSWFTAPAPTDPWRPRVMRLPDAGPGDEVETTSRRSP